MGKNKGKQKVVNETKLPAWYESGSQDAISFANQAADNLAMPYMGNTVAGLDPLQSQAIALTGQNIGSTNPAFQQAGQTAAGVAGYNPMMVGNFYTPQSVAAGQQGYSYAPDQVQEGSFLSGNIGAYMDPYIQNVEQAALGNLNQAFRQNLNTISDGAINAGAFGGSRQGVMEGAAASDFALQFGDFSANLRSNAYNAATGLAGQDLARSMQAQLANQQAGMGNAQFGANLGLQNISNNLNSQQFNANLGLNAAQMAQQAALANQSAGLQGQQLNLQAAGMQGDLATAGQQANLQGIQAALSAGQINQAQAQALLNQEQSQYDAMRNVPLEQLNIRMAPLGGMQVGSSATQTTPTSGNFLTGAAGGALAGMPFGPLGMIGGGLLGGLAGR
jgi:hypothetical protein